MTVFRAITCAALALLLSSPSMAADDYIRDQVERVKAADWAGMETITVSIDEHNYTPSDLRFKAGKPYRLQLRNVGKKDHYFTAETFFRAVAWRKAMVEKAAEVKAPYFSAFEILKGGGQVDLYFIPVTRGKYEVHCSIDDHKEQGMHGTLVIE